MRFPPLHARTSATLGALSLAAMVPTASALKIRDESTGGPYQWLWGQPNNPVLNPSFQPSAQKLRGVGWAHHATEWHRHYTLVSPRHYLAAAHYPRIDASIQGGDPPAGPSIRFLGSDGQMRSYVVASEQVIKVANVATDLLLGTLAAEVDSTVGITPLKVLRTRQTTDYAGRELIVMGKAGRGGRASADAFPLYQDGSETTRRMRFDYPLIGVPSDARVESGDSGTPTFVEESGELALVGVHSDLNENFPVPGAHQSFDVFLPEYYPQVDSLMEAEGYHLRRLDPGTVDVSVSAAGVSTLRRAMPGSVAIQLSNAGPADAHNVTATLNFGSSPDSVSGPGWICENAGGGVWNCRRGGVANAASATLTADWSVLPVTAEMSVSIEHAADGAAPETVPQPQSLLPSFAEWSSGVLPAGLEEDGDFDGVINLFEYAFGGSGEGGPSPGPDGGNLLPALSDGAGMVVLEFPRRSDAGDRGLSYTVEYAESLGGWSTTLPVGAVVETVPFDPPVAGFEQIRVSLPVGEGGFLRVGVGLAE